MTAPHHPSAILAHFVSTFPAGNLPPDLRDAASRAVFSATSAAIAGARDPETRAILRVLLPFSAAPQAGIFGHPERVDVLQAAFANAMIANALDFDDTHAGTILHPTSPVLAVVLARSEWLASSPAESMAAFTIGCEVSCRVADAVSPEHYRRGWHITASCGVFGAAAAAARLLGLDARQVVWAFGNASAQASGTVETLGTMAKSIGVGNAARAGLLAALMAREGVAGPSTPLEGRLGYLSLVTDAPRLSALTDGLGSTWSFLRNMLKPYPCGVVLNPVIEAAIALHSRIPDPGQIRSIRVTGCALLQARTDRPDAQTPRELQVCAQHCVSAALLRGQFGPEEVSAAAAADPAILTMRPRVELTVDDDGYDVDSAQVTLVLASAEEITQKVDPARGSLARPPGLPDLTGKARIATGDAALAQRLCGIVERLWQDAPLSELRAGTAGQAAGPDL